MSRILLLTSNPRQDLKLNREISDLTSVIQRLSSLESILALDRRKNGRWCMRNALGFKVAQFQILNSVSVI